MHFFRRTVFLDTNILLQALISWTREKTLARYLSPRDSEEGNLARKNILLDPNIGIKNFKQRKNFTII